MQHSPSTATLIQAVEIDPFTSDHRFVTHLILASKRRKEDAAFVEEQLRMWSDEADDIE
jgi:hypothetical protein